jgi:hypothetical protein
MSIVRGGWSGKRKGLAFPKPTKEEKQRKYLNRTSRPRKRRKGGTYGALEDKVDKAFARYVKERDGPVCITCKKTITSPQDHHAGHFIGRSKRITRWDPKNVHSQCGFVCNKVKRGSSQEYALFILEKYGAEELKRLLTLKNVQHKWRRDQLEGMLEALGRSGADFEIYYYSQLL